MSIKKFKIRVKPGSKNDHVGGTWGDDGPLNVWVSKPAVDGAANRAAIEILAGAFRLRRRQIEIVNGHSARTKTIQVTNAPEDFDQRLEDWRRKA